MCVRVQGWNLSILESGLRNTGGREKKNNVSCHTCSKNRGRVLRILYRITAYLFNAFCRRESFPSSFFLLSPRLFRCFFVFVFLFRSCLSMVSVARRKGRHKSTFINSGTGTRFVIDEKVTFWNYHALPHFLNV